MRLSQLAQSMTPSPTLAIDTKAKWLKAKGQDVVNFGIGEPDFDTPEFIKKAAVNAINQGFTKYTPVSGIVELKEAIARIFEEDYGLYYEPNQIMVSNGAKQCLYNALFCLCDPGDEVLIPAPYWVSYPEMVRFCRAKPVYVPTKEENDFRLDVEVIEPLINKNTKVLIINSPNNPTGSVYPRKDLVKIAELAVKHDLFVISDEIYDKLIYGGEKHVSIASLGPEIFARTLVVNGVSKAYAMTGWRIGFALGPKELISAMTNLQSHATSNPNSIAQKASLEALRNPERLASIAVMAREFDARRRRMVEMINQIPGLSCRMPSGAFYVMVNIRQSFGKSLHGFLIKDSSTFAEALLDEYKVAVVPGIAFGADDFVRLSYATSMANIEKGIQRIDEFMQALK